MPVRRPIGALLALTCGSLLCLWALHALRQEPAEALISLQSQQPWSQQQLSGQQQPASCDRVPAFESVWGAYEPDLDGSMQAAAFTPFHITPGGGEKYLLSVVQALQMAGYNVTVYTWDGNSCRSKEQLLATAEALRVTLLPELLTLAWWLPSDDWLPPRVRVFFALGNDKFPQTRNIGQLGFFMCQFPFDLDAPPEKPEQVQALATYDHVLLNSRFSLRWFNTFITPTIMHYQQQALPMPSVDILHPPCTILQHDTASQRTNIVLLGRFFEGRQSKGHVHAIRLFADLVHQLPQHVQLLFIGQLVQDHDNYLLKLRDMVSALPSIARRVQFAVSASPDVVAAMLQTAAVQWHMTGLEIDPNIDPASREHFGISIVECMSAGTIPIALHGGPEDIIDHGVDGFLAASAQDIARHTLQVFGAKPQVVGAMRVAASMKAATFSFDSFRSQFQAYVQRGLLARPHRHLVAATARAMRTCATLRVAGPGTALAAMIIEPRNHYALEYAIYNVMSILRKSTQPWALHIVHTSVNQQLVRRIVASHPGLRSTQLHELPASTLETGNINRLMTSSLPWELLGSVEKVLLFHTDSLIVNPGVDRFLKYDYVGPPWHQGNEHWADIVKAVPTAVGGGGFSLRTVSVMKDIAKKFGGPLPSRAGVVGAGGLQEDVFFASNVFRDHLLSPRATAYDFCIEVPCDDLVQGPDGPFAVHGIWHHSKLPIVQELLYQSFVSAVCDDCVTH